MKYNIKDRTVKTVNILLHGALLDTIKDQYNDRNNTTLSLKIMQFSAPQDISDDQYYARI